MEIKYCGVLILDVRKSFNGNFFYLVTIFFCEKFLKFLFLWKNKIFLIFYKIKKI